MLEHATEGNDLTTSLIDAITDHLVHRIKGRGDIVQGAVGIGLLHTEFLDIEAVVHLEVVTHVAHIEGIEPCLCISQGCLHL